MDQVFLKESIYLAILEDYQTYYLYIRYGSHPIQALVPVGGNGPLHATATGKSLLAFQTSEFIQSFLSKPLRKFTPKTITNPDQLQLEIEKIRKNFYSRVDEEFETDFSGIAVPILDAQNNSLAAVGISSPSSRFTSDHEDKMVQIALDAARGRTAGTRFAVPTQCAIPNERPIFPDHSDLGEGLCRMTLVFKVKSNLLKGQAWGVSLVSSKVLPNIGLIHELAGEFSDSIELMPYQKAGDVKRLLVSVYIGVKSKPGKVIAVLIREPYPTSWDDLDCIMRKAAAQFVVLEKLDAVYQRESIDQARLAVEKLAFKIQQHRKSAAAW